MSSRSVYLSLVLGSAATAALLAIGGCDTSFEPFSETDKVFSVWGYLDASADTQWVRVEMLQDSVIAGSGSFEARVTMRHLETGQTTRWRDSLFHVEATDAAVHNFWTTAAIEPGVMYRLTVERPSDGATSTAEVTIPDDFPEPTVRRDGPPPTDPPPVAPPTLVTVRGVERLGAAMATTRLIVCTYGGCHPPRTVTFSHLADTTRIDNDSYRIAANWAADLLTLWDPDDPDSEIRRVFFYRVTVANVSEAWPDYNAPVPDFRNPTWEGGSTPRQLPGGGASNIENGVGFLGGAVTRTVDIMDSTSESDVTP